MSRRNALYQFEEIAPIVGTKEGDQAESDRSSGGRKCAQRHYRLESRNIIPRSAGGSSRKLLELGLG